jgi:hypothetical protein
MQALSHFSYHVTNGELLYCDAQGGITTEGIVFTDPVIMSRTQEYGPTDLGINRISNFFAHHTCNKFCKSTWKSPAQKKVYFNVKKGTTMVGSFGNGAPVVDSGNGSMPQQMAGGNGLGMIEE